MNHMTPWKSGSSPSGEGEVFNQINPYLTTNHNTKGWMHCYEAIGLD